MSWQFAVDRHASRNSWTCLLLLLRQTSWKSLAYSWRNPSNVHNIQTSGKSWTCLHKSVIYTESAGVFSSFFFFSFFLLRKPSVVQNVRASRKSCTCFLPSPPDVQNVQPLVCSWRIPSVVRTVPHFQEVVNSLSLSPSEVQDIRDVQKVLNVFLRRLNMSLTSRKSWTCCCCFCQGSRCPWRLQSCERIFAEVQDIPDVKKVLNVFCGSSSESPDVPDFLNFLNVFWKVRQTSRKSWTYLRKSTKSATAMARYVSQSVLVCSFCCNTSTEGRGRIWEINETFDNQNSAARTVLKKRKRARPYNTYPLLNELRWLPVTFRLEYKVETFAYRHLDSSLNITLFHLSASLCTY